MNKYKITGIEQITGLIIAEIKDDFNFPVIQEPIHYFSDGRNCTVIKVERVLDATENNTIDLSNFGEIQQ